MTYAQDLAKVGLYPDNPDAMYTNLLMYIANPVAFKNRDPNWPGSKDNIVWWEDPKNVVTFNWPFHGGKWYDACPKNDAQMRAVFKAPKGVATMTWMHQVLKLPANIKGWRTQQVSVSSGFDLFKIAENIVDAAGKFLLSIPGVKDAAKLYIDLDFGALSAIINAFIPSPASDILHGVSSVAQDQAKRQLDGLGLKSPPEIVDMILKELHFLGDALEPVRYFVERMLSTNQYDPTFFANLLTFQVPPNATEHEKALAVGAKDMWNNNVSAPIKQIVPPLTRMIVSMATTGKIMKSDLLDLVGAKGGTRDVVSKILDMFGVNDNWPVNVAKATFNLPPPAPTPPQATPDPVSPGNLRFYEVVGQMKEKGNDVAIAGRKTAGNGTRGFDIGLGVMSQKTSPIFITIIRQKLNQDDLKGFDIAASLAAGILTHPPSKAPATMQVAYFVTKGMQGQPPNNAAALTKAVTGTKEGEVGATIAKNQIATDSSKTKTLLTAAGGAIAGLAVAGPIGAPIGAGLGWALGRFLK